MPRDRAQIDLGGPLLREREGVKLTERSLSSRLCEVIDRLGVVARHAAPGLHPQAWELVCWQGWDALFQARISSHPQDADDVAWGLMVEGIREWIAEHDKQPAPSWAVALSERLEAMSPVERVAVWERVEAYGRAEAMK